jgi:hypothetical protein
MKNRILFLASFLFAFHALTEGQERHNIIGAGIGMSPEYESAVWIGDPLNLWVTKKSSPVFQLFYARQVSDDVRLGGYFEYESASFTAYGGAESKATRLNIGVNWLAMFPKSAFHMQLGGYLGYGSIKAADWDQALYGSDIGIIAGPAYETDMYGIAIQAQYGKGYYTSSGIPTEVGLAIPKFILKVYTKLP